MGTDYPGALDTFTNPAPTDGMNLPSHAEQHANANDAIAAIQAELGTNPSGSYDTVKDRLAALAGGGGGGAGGLVLIASGTFAASSGFSVDDVFSSDYDDYLVSLVCTASADLTLAIQLRAGGTDSATGYSSVRSFQYGTTSGVQTDNLGTDEWQVNNLGAVSSPGSTRIDLFSPARPERSSMVGQSAGYFSSTGAIITQFGGSHDVASPFDGMSIRPAGGTITGRWAVYGYPK